MKMILSAILATVIFGVASAAPPTHFVKDVRFNEDGAGADTVMAEADAIKINSITAFIETLLDDANAAAARGTLELASTSTDNALVRFNGTTGGTQNGLTKEDDSGNVTTAGNLKVGTGASAGTITIEAGTSVPDVIITAESTGGAEKTFRIPSDNTVNSFPNYAVWSRYRWTGTLSQPNLWIGTAGNSTLTGAGNYGIGARALASVTSGFLNVGNGEDALANLTTGAGNVADGESAGMWVRAGDGNTFVGSDAGGGDEEGAGVRDGDDNTGVGNNAGLTSDGLGGYTNQDGSSNTAVGANTVFGTGAASYRTIVGAEAVGTADNQIMLGRSTDHTWIWDLRVDNLKADGNTISSTDTNGNINLTPNGTGDVAVTGDLTVSANATFGDTNADAHEVKGSLTWNATTSAAEQIMTKYNGASSQWVQRVYSSSNTFDRAVIAGDRYGGTQASPATVANSYQIFSLLGRAWDGTNLRAPAEVGMRIAATGTIDETSMPSEVYVSTTADSSTSRTERWKWTSDGDYVPVANNTYDIGTALLAPTDIYSVNALTVTSDRRKKKDIEDSTLGLSFVRELRPVDFKWNDAATTTGLSNRLARENEKHTGFIAQEVREKLLTRGIQDSGIVAYDEAADVYGMRPTELIPVLVKAIQEQQAQIDALTLRIEDLEAVSNKKGQAP